ncbi:capsid protein [Capybara virus 34_cap3_7672]|nr:capsid protein [Capybara virus 34_cap3_7672]
MPRFRRSFRRRPRYRKRKSRFVRAVQRAELKNSSSKKIVYATESGVSLAQGDGVSRTLLIQTPVSNIVQGTGKQNFVEDTISNVFVRVRAAISTNTTNAQFNQVFVRWTVFWSPSRASYLAAGSLFGNTTTSSANPAQVVPFANPTIFDVASGSGLFVGTSFATPFDTTNIRIIATRTFSINSGGAANGMIIKKFTLPIAKKIRFQDNGESPLTVTPNFPRNGQYYIIRQIFGNTGTSNIANTAIANIDATYTLYFKDI